MSASLVELAPIETMAELLERLGDIGPERICMRPPPGMATEADVLTALEAPRKRICELIDGVLVEKANGFCESVLKTYLIWQLYGFVRPRKLGVILGPTGAIRLWAGRVRIPGVAFYSWDRLPNRRLPEEAIPTLAPDLAIEVGSAGNTAREMLLERQDYFSMGVRLVWEINPRARTASVYTSSESAASILTESDVLDGSPVLAGFTLSLHDLFAELDRHG